MPIPKTDPGGQPLGYWRADDVLQTDPRSLGRGGSVAGEQMADDGDVAAAPALPGATPGREHLSALREPYLQLLAGETGLRYHRLRDVDALLAALTDASLRRERPGHIDLRPWLGGAALVALLLALGLLRALRSLRPERRHGMRVSQRGIAFRNTEERRAAPPQNFSLQKIAFRNPASRIPSD